MLDLVHELRWPVVALCLGFAFLFWNKSYKECKHELSEDDDTDTVRLHRDSK